MRLQRVVACAGLVATAQAFAPGTAAPPARTHRFRPLVRPLPAWAPSGGMTQTRIAITALAPPRRRVATVIEAPTVDITVVDPYTAHTGSKHFCQAPMADLLTKEEEVTLARLVQQRMLWDALRHGLTSELQREPTLSEWAARCGFGGGWQADDEFARALADGQAAKAAMINANLRLVLFLAKRHKAQPGAYARMHLSDLVQEGILGLVKAVEKFDPERGFRFSTYATWWIKLSITRAITDQGRTIRLPVHVHDTLRSLRRAVRELTMELGRPVTDAEVAKRLGVSVEKVQWLYQCQRSEPISLNQQQHSAGVRSDLKAASTTVGDAVHDTHLTPEDYTNLVAMQDDVDNFLRSLNPRERVVLRMRYGLDNGGRGETLERVGEHIGVTRERVRQIELRALERLRVLSAKGHAAADAAREHH